MNLFLHGSPLCRFSQQEEFFRPARILEASYEQHRYMKARDSEERFNTRNDGKASRHSDKATSESAQKQNIDAATHFIHDNKKQMDSNEFKKVSQHIVSKPLPYLTIYFSFAFTIFPFSHLTHIKLRLHTSTDKVLQ